MKELLKYIFDLPSRKSVRFFSIGMLVILCLLSSCSIRKGIESFFSDQLNTTLSFNKGAKLSLIKKQGLEYNSTDCKVIGLGLDDVQLSVKQVSSPMAMLPFLFLVLPEFLVSLLISCNLPTALPVPNSWLRWSYLPLFLQNRLLLI